MLRKTPVGLFVFLTGVLSVALASCIPDAGYPPTFMPLPSNLTDQSILNDDPCKAPCWYGLKPDSSSKQDALDTVAGLDFLNSTDIKIQNANWWGEKAKEYVPATLIRIWCKQPSNTICVHILTVDDKIKSISIIPNYRLTLDDFVEYFGEPDYVLPSYYGAECMGCMLSVVWVKDSVEVSINDLRCAKGADLCNNVFKGEKLPNHLVVGAITYSGSIPTYVDDFQKESRYPWAGFTSP
jgi:hypothetical protein